ncbi:hypothetical protein J3R83DRAFT_3428 [Lanmaoa asiatica]|nr:hypothetical protein J3R83DRAFT_3428 [Lanmaoa asiatica]
MPVTAWLFHSNSFCCCIPVRAGFVLMSILTFLLSGTVSIIIWFEISHSYQLSSKERIAFILTGIVESLLFLASTVGFIGVVARKQLFVMTYTYFLYTHFVINLIVGIYFLVTVRASNRQQLIDDCAEVLVNTSMESSCSDLTNVSTYVFIAIVAALLLLELYGALIATRYVNRLRVQKRHDRSQRLGYFHALSKPETPSTRHTRHASDNVELLHSRESTGDPQDPEDIVFDIRPPSYIPVWTHDRDLSLVPAPNPSLSPPHSLSDTASGRRIRALPPRPVGTTASPDVTQTSSCPQENAVQPGRLPNPHERSDHTPKGGEPQPPGSEDGQHSLYTAELSTAAHAALMDHATYMGFPNEPTKPNSGSTTSPTWRTLGRDLDETDATTTDSQDRLDDMHKRHDVQRQHIIDSLDNLIFQLYTLSFFLSPTLLPLLCRVTSQFIFYKPRELDPKLSLRVWILLLCASNAPSFWSHARDGAAEGRAVILDFVGMGGYLLTRTRQPAHTDTGYPPSKLHLVLLDTLIFCLQMLLTTISFEISVRLSSLSDLDSSAIPSSPALSPPRTPSLEIDRGDGDDRKYAHHHTPTMIIDLRFHHLINRLRNPIPLASDADLTTLPLPNTTPTPLSMHLRAIVRRREEARRRVPDQSDSAETANSSRTEDAGRIPGSMSTE